MKGDLERAVVVACAKMLMRHSPGTTERGRTAERRIRTGLARNSRGLF
jgi:hypothetical protein